jgi:hypothetical protein
MPRNPKYSSLVLVELAISNFSTHWRLDGYALNSQCGIAVRGSVPSGADGTHGRRQSLPLENHRFSKRSPLTTVGGALPYVHMRHIHG